MKKHTIYSLIAVKSVTTLEDYSSPLDAWKAACKKYAASKSAQDKGCPKSTFLGLCEEGYVKGIKKGKYTNSKINKSLGIEALEILMNNRNKEYSRRELWNNINVDKTHNSQMDVVLALWDNDLIEK
tara:strand:+ start:124059 stop:124439 length:381 start_codon:yes stop_codon:yes gene_type:complete